MTNQRKREDRKKTALEKKINRTHDGKGVPPGALPWERSDYQSVNIDKKSRTPQFRAGAIAFVFLVLGYQSAVLVHKASVAAIVARSSTTQDASGNKSPDASSTAIPVSSRYREDPAPSSSSHYDPSETISAGISSAHSTASNGTISTGISSDRSTASNGTISAGISSDRSTASSGTISAGINSDRSTVSKGTISAGINSDRSTASSGTTSTGINSAHSTASNGTISAGINSDRSTASNGTISTGISSAYSMNPIGTATSAPNPSSSSHQVAHPDPGKTSGRQAPDNRLHTAEKAILKAHAPAMTFRFNPNTVSVDSLVLLGFSQRQAESIEAYREKGGKFWRPADFAKSYVVDEKTFARLEAYIDLPPLDLNRADSAAFDALPGIGPYFASKMVSYRESLGGYYRRKEQLLDIYNFGQERYDALADLVCVSQEDFNSGKGSFDVWTATFDELKNHPAIRSTKTARNIILYRESTPKDAWTLSGLLANGIITQATAAALKKAE